MRRRHYADRLVLVTGASRGIGRALALAMAGRGARLLLGARQQADLEAVACACRAAGAPAAHAWPLDLSDGEQCRGWVARARQELGEIDCLINNAGISMRSLFADVSMDVVRRVMEVNFFGTTELTLAALPSLREQRGQVMVVSSLTGIAGIPGRSAYSASKFALHGLFESIRIEERGRVGVLIVCPGFTATGIRETALGVTGGEGVALSGETVGHVMSAEEVAERTIEAGERDRKLLVLTRSGRLLYMMKRLAPGKLDRMLARKLMRPRGGGSA